jgi:hypothetical protein
MCHSTCFCDPKKARLFGVPETEVSKHAKKVIFFEHINKS